VNTKIRHTTRDRVRLPFPKPSSPWPCSTSVATAPSSRARYDPRISQVAHFSSSFVDLLTNLTKLVSIGFRSHTRWSYARPN